MKPRRPPAIVPIKVEWLNFGEKHVVGFFKLKFFKEYFLLCDSRKPRIGPIFGVSSLSFTLQIDQSLQPMHVFIHISNTKNTFLALIVVI